MLYHVHYICYRACHCGAQRDFDSAKESVPSSSLWSLVSALLSETFRDYVPNFRFHSASFCPIGAPAGPSGGLQVQQKSHVAKMSFDERAPSSTPLDQNKLQETSNTSPEASRLATGVVQSPSEARKDCCDGALTQNTEQASSSSSSNEPSAEQLLESGKAALRLGEVESAVEKFSESVEKK